VNAAASALTRSAPLPQLAAAGDSMHGVRSYNSVWGRPDWREPPAIEPTIRGLIAHAARHFPGNDYIVFDEQRLTFREAEERSARLATQLIAAGVGKASRVGILFPNSPAFMIVYLAVERIGAVAVPISTLSTPAELLAITRHADLELLIAAASYLHHDYSQRCEAAFPGLRALRGRLFLPDAPSLRAIWIWGERVPAWARPAAGMESAAIDSTPLANIERQVVPNDVATIIYTSGSTAAPKGIIHSHGNLVRQASKLYSNFPYTPDDRLFSPLPFFWVGGLVMCALHMLLAGGAILGSSRRGAALLDFIENENATYVHAYPHVARMLAAEPSFPKRRFSAMRGGRLVAAVPELLRPKNQIFAAALGMTETCGPHTVAYFDVGDELRGSLGTPMPNMEHRIEELETRREAGPGEVGELVVRGDTLMIGMVKRKTSEVFQPGGWYRTGDLCSFRQGHLFFHGRVDDMIKTAGANVSPAEIEGVLKTLHGVAQAYVYGVPDSVRGSVVGAIVVPEPDALLSPDELRAAVARWVSSYKVPRIILVVQAAEIPLTSSTKADRRAMTQLLQDAYAATASPDDPAKP
jgi:acyl-CoA synthetase (AMP-forming)/AMP-acid ligase II